MGVIGLPEAELKTAQGLLDTLRQQEITQLERTEKEQRIYEKLVFAMETQDEATLCAVIAEAEAAGVDAAPARAALEEVRGQRFGAHRREPSPERTGFEHAPEYGAGGGLPSQSDRPYQ